MSYQPKNAQALDYDGKITAPENPPEVNITNNNADWVKERLESFEKSFMKAGDFRERRSPITLNYYKRIIGLFLVKSGKKEKYSEEDIKVFLGYLASRSAARGKRSWSMNSLRTAYFALRSFIRVSGWGETLPKPNFPRQKITNVPFFRYEQVQKILGAAKGHLRDYCILRLSAVTGLRRIEISESTKEDFDPPRIFIRTRKGGEARQRDLDEETVEVIKGYLSERKDHSPWLFVGKGNKKLSLSWLSKIFKKYRNRAGFPRKGAGYHANRRGICTEQHEKGMSERDLMELLGWTSYSMPFRYIRVAPAKVEQKYKENSPFFKEKEAP